MNYSEESLKKKTIINQIENIVLKILIDLSNLSPPEIKINDIISYDEDSTEERPRKKRNLVSLCNQNSFNKFSRILKVLSTVHFNLLTNNHSNKRDIYYQNPKLFGGRQSNLDNVVVHVSKVLRVPRMFLHVHASSKGLVAGNLVFRDSTGLEVDFSLFSKGLAVPANIDKNSTLKSEAKFLLVIEKDATFQQLLSQGFVAKHAPCLIVTGKGYPDLATRNLVMRLSCQLLLPTYCLVDADPYGIHIMSVYKLGTNAMSEEEARLACPNLKWLGILPSDLLKLRLPAKVLLPLTTRDINKINTLTSKPHYSQTWKKELQLMKEMKIKAELQSLDAISPNFLSDVYLALKIKNYSK